MIRYISLYKEVRFDSLEAKKEESKRRKAVSHV